MLMVAIPRVSEGESYIIELPWLGLLFIMPLICVLCGQMWALPLLIAYGFGGELCALLLTALVLL